MKIEAVIVCKDYSDFLAEALPMNINHVDRIVVVTSYSDHKTHALCSKYSIDCIQTNVFADDGDKFNKGRTINLGLAHCKADDWVLHLDADIVLPHRFRDMLFRAKLNKGNLYGADRLNVYGFDHWQEHKPKTIPHYANRYFVEAPREFPLGARIIHEELGYTPIGYFQLFHGSLGRRYPIHQGNAEHTDVLFAALWPREQRILLPEIIVYHLESVDGPKPMGANWNGRTTPVFESKRKFGTHHHHHHHPEPYKPDEDA